MVEGSLIERIAPGAIYHRVVGMFIVNITLVNINAPCGITNDQITRYNITAHHRVPWGRSVVNTDFIQKLVTACLTGEDSCATQNRHPW